MRFYELRVTEMRRRRDGLPPDMGGNRAAGGALARFQPYPVYREPGTPPESPPATPPMKETGKSTKEPSVKRPRGRPRKLVMDLTEGSLETPMVSSGRPRGRPRKISGTVFDDSMGTPASSYMDKGKGKVDIEEEELPSEVQWFLNGEGELPDIDSFSPSEFKAIYGERSLKVMIENAIARTTNDPKRKALLVHINHLLDAEDRYTAVELDKMLLEYNVESFLETYAPDFELCKDLEIRRKALGGPGGSTTHARH